MRGDQAGWPLLNGGLIPDGMIFVTEPPATIGEVLGAWTNNGPAGPKQTPLVGNWLTIGLGAMAGFVVGLIGFFVVGGVLQHRHVEVAAEWFLYAIAGGSLVGALIGLWAASRPTGVRTLFIGKEGCVELGGSGPGARARALLFRDVQSIRSHVSVTRVQGMRIAARELHVRSTDGKERLWWLSAPPGEQKADDANFEFGELVLRAFEAYRQRG